MATTYTFQDFEKADDAAEFMLSAISSHKSSDSYKTAMVADEYDRQKNVTINQYVQTLYGSDGTEVEDFTASNNKIASNFFNRLNTQRVQYSLGAGVSFVQPGEDANDDVTKAALGPNFDHTVVEAAYYSCIHGVSFVFWNLDRCHMFKLTEFVPLYDEVTGMLRAGIRFWQLDSAHPLSITLYREDGFSEWRRDEDNELSPLDRDGEPTSAEVVQAYKTETAYIPFDDEATVIGEENYGVLPIVPMWTSRLRQSTLIGMRSVIDAYDLVKSGFANDLQDCATVYWIVRNAGGMTDADLAEFRDRIKLQHVASIDSTDGADVSPYTQDIPFQARETLLTELRNGLYEDFGALDVHTVAAGATNDHIDAAYQPMDENAADFEYWVGDCIKQLTRLAGVEDLPVFTRTRISNQNEQVSLIATESQWLDRATILRKLPNIKPDEIAGIMQALDDEDMKRFGVQGALGE